MLDKPQSNIDEVLSHLAENEGAALWLRQHALALSKD